MNRVKTLIFFLLLMVASVYGQQPDSFMLKAIRFLHKDSPSNSYNIHFLTTWLAQKYSFEDVLPYSIDTLQPKFKDDEPVFNFYNKLLGSKNKQTVDSLKRLYELNIGLEHLLLWGCNAEILSFDSICRNFINENLTNEVNIRQLFHIVLAFHWSEGYCNAASRAFYTSQKKKIKKMVLELLKEQRIGSDNWLEGVLALLCMGEKAAIDETWIHKLKELQLSNGGWSWNALPGEHAHHHTTILALWVLLSMSV